MFWANPFIISKMPRDFVDDDDSNRIQSWILMMVISSNGWSTYSWVWPWLRPATRPGCWEHPTWAMPVPAMPRMAIRWLTGAGCITVRQVRHCNWIYKICFKKKVMLSYTYMIPFYWFRGGSINLHYDPYSSPPKPNLFRRFRWAFGHAIAGQDHKLIIDLDGSARWWRLRR